MKPAEEEPQMAIPPLQTLLDRQMEAWLRGERLTAEAFLEEYPSLRGDERLHAVVCNEIALREAMGESPAWEEYRERFPHLAVQLRPRFFTGEASIVQRPVNSAAVRTASLERTVIGAAPPPSPRADPLSLQPTLVNAAAPTNPASDMSSSHQMSVAGYELLDELGRGGMGVVYRARHIKLNRIVALKMVLSGGHASSEELARFRLEAEAVAQLKHPNIVQIFDVGESFGKPYFSLEFVEGGSLERKLNRSTLTGPQAAELVEALSRGMHTAHEQGIIHRDLKPANILLTKDGTPKVTDFGLAKQLQSESGSGRTQSGSVMGTPSYMSPEQAEGNLEVLGPATDVYALGAILYSALTGRPPFKGATVMETINQVIHDEPVPPSRLQPGVPRDLETICLKCLEKQPRKRYASAAELADDLRRYLDGEPIHARAMGPAERAWRWCRRNPVVTSLLVTVVLGSAFGMWYLSRLSSEVVRSSALESARQESEMFDQLNDFYSDRVVKDSGIKATHAYRTEPNTIPAPATLTIDLGDYISAHSKMGQHVRLYSDDPFQNRVQRGQGGPRDEFERQAIAELRKNPEQPFYRFEPFQGRPSLRFATARVMKESCVACHNTHPDSSRRDWHVGDVRGVLEVIRPLDADEERAQAGLRGTLVLIGGFFLVLLLFSSLVMFLGRRHRRTT
jgi:serine/threonine protein kinase